MHIVRREGPFTVISYIDLHVVEVRIINSVLFSFHSSVATIKVPTRVHVCVFILKIVTQKERKEVRDRL